MDASEISKYWEGLLSKRFERLLREEALVNTIGVRDTRVPPHEPMITIVDSGESDQEAPPSRPPPPPVAASETVSADSSTPDLEIVNHVAGTGPL